MNPPASQPASLVEAGLGPSRGDRARPELEHGTLRRRATGGQLQQDSLPQLQAVEAPDLGGDPNREGRSAGRTRHDDPSPGRLPDPGCEKAPV